MAAAWPHQFIIHGVHDINTFSAPTVSKSFTTMLFLFSSVYLYELNSLIINIVLLIESLTHYLSLPEL